MGYSVLTGLCVGVGTIRSEELPEFLTLSAYEELIRLGLGDTASYQAARDAGALGGKITGAGGGGFLLLYCPRERQEPVRQALKDMRELPFHLEQDGAKVIFNYRR